MKVNCEPAVLVERGILLIFAHESFTLFIKLAKLLQGGKTLCPAGAGPQIWGQLIAKDPSSQM